RCRLYEVDEQGAVQGVWVEADHVIAGCRPVPWRDDSREPEGVCLDDQRGGDAGGLQTAGLAAGAGGVSVDGGGAAAWGGEGPAWVVECPEGVIGDGEIVLEAAEPDPAGSQGGDLVRVLIDAEDGCRSRQPHGAGAGGDVAERCAQDALEAASWVDVQQPA